MSDNVNIIVQDTINEIVVNSAVIVETIDINVQVAVDEVTIIANPNEYIINVNRIIGEQVQSDWNETDDQAPDYIKNKPIIPAAVTKTSDLINDGEDGINPFITLEDIPVSGLTSVGLTMPVAFNVANSPLTSDGTIAVSAAGTSSQYIRGDGQLATLPTGAGGGSTVAYYLNGSINASVVGYKQLSNLATIGGGTDFTLVGNGLIAQFLTDLGNPNRTEIPGGAWNFEMYFQSSSAGGSAKFYVELLKYDGITFTSIASSVSVPEEITGGTAIDLYLTSLAVPTTTLLVTDRLAIRVYIVDNSGGRTITLHTEDNTLCEIITTFSGGVTSLNGLTANTQYLAVGTTGTDFNISSLVDTHTFNLPTASATNRGALSTTDWTTFNGKFTLPTLTNGSVLFSNGTTIAQDNSNFFWDDTNNRLGIGTITPATTLDVRGNQSITTANSGYGFNLSRIGGYDNITLNALAAITDTTSNANVTKTGLYINVTSATRNIAIQTIGAVGVGVSPPNNSFASGYFSYLYAGATVNSAANYNLNVRSTISSYAAGNGGGISFWGDDRNQAGANTAFAGIRGIKENGTYLNGLGALTFLTQASSVGLSTESTFAEVGRFTSNGNLLINTTTDNGGKLQIKAPGALSTDIALRVRNSADTRDLMTVNGLGILYIDPTNGNGKIQFAAGTGISNTAGVGLNIGQIFAVGGGGYSIKLWDNNNTVNYAKFLSSNICFSSTNITTTAASAQFQVDSTTRGFLPPRMTNAQRLAIATPAVGLCVYCTDAVEGLYINKSTGWTYIG